MSVESGHIPTPADAEGTLICIGPDRYHPVERAHYPQSFGSAALTGLQQAAEIMGSPPSLEVQTVEQQAA